MRLTTLLSAAVIAAAPSLAAPLDLLRHLTAKSTAAAPGEATWQVYSLREQPFDNAELTFTFSDPNNAHETFCKTALPMNGYATCADGKTSFLYTGASYQYGPTVLTLQRQGVADCTDARFFCKHRAATGKLNLPGNFWQQPGWNSWVHPEALDVHWTWASQ